jgi:hypothetical protein
MLDAPPPEPQRYCQIAVASGTFVVGFEDPVEKPGVFV